MYFDGKKLLHKMNAKKLNKTEVAVRLYPYYELREDAYHHMKEQLRYGSMPIDKYKELMEIINGADNVPRRRKDDSGHRFGHLTVIGLSEKKGSHGASYYRCKCDCGTIKDIRADNLRRGFVTSCGCRGRNSEWIPRKSENENGT